MVFNKKKYPKYILIKFNLNFRVPTILFFFFARLSSTYFFFKYIDGTSSIVVDDTLFDFPDWGYHISVQEFKLGYSDKKYFKIYFNLKIRNKYF